MKKWFKNWFELDDESEEPIEKTTEEPKSEKKIHKNSPALQQPPDNDTGRFGDPMRRLDARMIHHYPKKREKKRYYNRFAKQDDGGKSVPKKPFTPTEIPSPIYGFRHSNQNNDSNKKRDESKLNASDKESVTEKGFTPTEIPSPVYGFRRPIRKIETRDEGHDVPKPSEPGTLQEPIHQSEKQTDIPEQDNSTLDLETDEHEVRDVTDEERRVHGEHGDTEEQTESVEYQDQTPEAEEKQNYERSHNNKAIPYNVLMFRADSREEKVEQQEPSEPIKDSQSSLKPARKPSISALQHPKENVERDESWVQEKEMVLAEALKNFNVKADIVRHVQGPTVTRFEIKLHPGVKINKVLSLTEDIKLTMAAEQVRIAPVSGKNTVGIEIPNESRKPVLLGQLIASQAYQDSKSPLTAALGLDVTGHKIVTDLTKMPHGLVAGATGSGKSVCIHSLILSLIYKSDPEDLRLLLIDPKVVELAVYNELPHLAAPVITKPKEASMALKWTVEEMEKRYDQFAKSGVRDIHRYNERVKSGRINGEKLPYIVVIIDELADLMMTSPQEVEAAICRIAQKARAAGIHMILATQRPSVDVITGLIKANIPTRIAFSVSSQADSRTILDAGGADRLLGQGDLLFSENGARELKRVQGTFVTDEEIETVIDSYADVDAPSYLLKQEDMENQVAAADEDTDEIFQEAGFFVIDQGQASVSSIQRRFRVGYNRAARLIDQLEAFGVVSEANGSKPRQVLLSKEVFEQELAGTPTYY